MRPKWSKISLLVFVSFYAFAGLNHFINPEFYLSLIPPAFGDAHLINVWAGIAEMGLAILIIPEKTRKWSKYGVILMLIAFIPSHVYFIKVGSCVNEGLCVSECVAWTRLIIIHPLLILWAYSIK